MQRSVSVRGDAVIPFMANSPAFRSPKKGCVLLARHLTVEVARGAVENECVGVISDTGNFACHGANMLRTARRNGLTVGWIRGISSCADGSRLLVSVDGIVTAPGDSGLASVSGRHVRPELYSFDRDSEAAWKRVCLWADRRYPDAALELQMPGLSRSATLLAGSLVEVSADSFGRIWFAKPALTGAEIAQRMLDTSTCDSFIDLASRTYEALLSRIRPWRYHLPDRDQLLLVSSDFFATLLPFHDGYEDILLHHASVALMLSHDPRNVVSIACENAVTKWLYGLDGFRSSQKLMDDPSWVGQVPDVSVSSAITRVIDDLVGLGLSRDSWVVRIASICVLKEFKMIIAKNLFAAGGLVLTAN